MTEWKEIVTAHDLPTAEGYFVGKRTTDSQPEVLWFEPLMAYAWERFFAYIPVAIPEYGKEQR